MRVSVFVGVWSWICKGSERRIWRDQKASSRAPSVEGVRLEGCCGDEWILEEVEGGGTDVAGVVGVMEGDAGG